MPDGKFRFSAASRVREVMEDGRAISGRVIRRVQLWPLLR